VIWASMIGERPSGRPIGRGVKRGEGASCSLSIRTATRQGMEGHEFVEAPNLSARREDGRRPACVPGRMVSMRTSEFEVDTSRERIVDLTEKLERFCADEGDGLVNIFVPHATAGIALMETGSGSEPDLLATLDRLLPRDSSYQHAHGSRGHGADHLLPVLVSPSVTIPVVRGRVVLGTWQSLVLVDLNVDNPRRHVRFTFLPA
jgi:secondary thiamine-phosphate synthase enzyme